MVEFGNSFEIVANGDILGFLLCMVVCDGLELLTRYAVECKCQSNPVGGRWFLTLVVDWCLATQPLSYAWSSN